MIDSVTNPWHIPEAEFLRGGSRSEQFRYLLHYAFVAPSGHNTQPWLFRVTDDGVELFADRTRALPVVDPEDRELLMSCGAALCQLRVPLLAVLSTITDNPEAWLATIMPRP
jgi:hypothetical protein